MLAKIFDIQNGKVVINLPVLTIPELRNVHDAYKDPIPALVFLWMCHDPSSPYANYPENEKETLAARDSIGEYSLEDDVIIKAREKLAALYMTPTYRYYLDNKLLLEKLGKFARDTTITTGRDGNLSALMMQVRSTGKTIQEFKQLEKIVKQEMSEGSTVRGGKSLAYDG